MMSEEKIYRIKAALRQEAKKKFPDDEARQQRYIWGTITHIKERRHMK